jgi:hypothetical protein
MKKFFITVALIVSTGAFTANASGNKSKDSKLNTTFAVDFTNAENVLWSSDADFYYASFTQDGKSITSVYDKETATFVGYLKTIDANNLPSTIRKIIADDFAGYKAVGAAIEIGGTEKDSYIFVIENDKSVLKVKTDSDGFSKVVSKIKKS